MVTFDHIQDAVNSARAFGEALRSVIERGHRRVALLATGGLSHWLDPGKFGFIDKDFDGYILDLLRAGRGLELANLEPSGWKAATPNPLSTTAANVSG